MPKRIQRRRTKGWRIPDNTVYVGRPSKWGNPWSPKNYIVVTGWKDGVPTGSRPATVEECVRAFREDMEADTFGLSEYLDELKGKNLACWCRPHAPCHADVLLEMANAID